MTLNDAYLVSQIAIAVLGVPTLLYLALQVRQNTKQLRAAARYQFVEATGVLNVGMATQRQAASVFRRGIEDWAGLDADERMQFFIMAGHFLQICSVMFELHEDRLLTDSQWHNVRKDLIALVGSSGGREVWKDFGAKGLDARFARFVEGLVANPEPSYDMTKVGGGR